MPQPTAGGGETSPGGAEGAGRSPSGARRLRDLDPARIARQRALIRVDYNVPLDDAGDVADDARIRASFPTLRYLLGAGARPVLLSHLGRPAGGPDPSLSLASVARTLEESFGHPVRFVSATDSGEAVEASRRLEEGTVLLLENVRFLPGETSDDPDLAERLARLGDLYVNDAFGAAHRSHASTTGVARLLRPAVMGLLVEREVEAFDVLRAEPDIPFRVVMGGAKISDKIGVLEAFLESVDMILTGGALANTLLAAAGHRMGRSLVEEEALGRAEAILSRAGEALVLPTDLVVAPDPERPGSVRRAGVDDLREEDRALDIGPRTTGRYAEAIGEARTVFWNGPLGLFEREAFAAGTRRVADAVARATGSGAFTVVGGGDSARALRQAGAADSVSHLSTGGGAALRYLAEGSLPALEALERS